MWNPQQLTETSGQIRHQLGKVTGQSGTAILVQGDTDYKSLRLAAPYGITWLPPENAVAVVLASGVGNGQNDICVGTRMESVPIAPGELLLQSAGGATIYLKNTGEVVINGQTFAKQEG